MKKIIDGYLIVYDDNNTELLHLLEKNFLFFVNIFGFSNDKKISLLDKDEYNYKVNYISRNSLNEFFDIFLDNIDEFISNSNINDLVFKIISVRTKSTECIKRLNLNKIDYTMKLLAQYIKDNNLPTRESIIEELKTKDDIYKRLEDNILNKNRYTAHDYLIELYYKNILKNDPLLIEELEKIKTLIEERINESIEPQSKETKEITFKELDTLVNQYFDYIKAPDSWKESYHKLRQENRILLTNTDIDKCIFKKHSQKEIILRINNNITLFPIFIHEFIHYLQDNRIDSLIEFPSIYFEGLSCRFIDELENTNLYKQFKESRQKELRRAYKDIKLIIKLLIEIKNNKLNSKETFKVLAKDLYSEGISVKDEQLDFVLETEKLLREKLRQNLKGEEIEQAIKEDNEVLSKGHTTTIEDLDKFIALSIPRTCPIKDSLIDLLKETDSKVEEISSNKCDESLNNIINNIVHDKNPINTIAYIIGTIYTLELLEKEDKYPNQLNNMIALVDKGKSITHKDVYDNLNNIVKIKRRK